MTRAIAWTIISRCPNSYPVPSRVHRHWPAGTVTCSFTINIAANLGPAAVTVLIDSHMTCFTGCAIISICPNSYPVPNRVHRDWHAGKVIRSFTINIAAQLTPAAVTVLIDSHMTRAIACAIIPRCPNGYPVPSRVHRNWPAGIVIRIFAIYVAA